MSEIIDKITEGAGQVISEFDKGGQIHSAISGIRQRMAESDRRRKINTIKQEIQDLQTKEAQAINSLSAQVLALYEAGSLSQPELVSLCRGVDEVRDQIREKEAELEQFEPPPSEQPQPSAGQSEAGTVARCPGCGVPIVKDAAFCQSCGTKLVKSEPPAPVLYCVHCGAQLREGARFCPKCGQTVPQSPT
jgi:hypothetical protein